MSTSRASQPSIYHEWTAVRHWWWAGIVAIGTTGLLVGESHDFSRERRSKHLEPPVHVSFQKCREVTVFTLGTLYPGHVTAIDWHCGVTISTGDLVILVAHDGQYVRTVALREMRSRLRLYGVFALRLYCRVTEHTVKLVHLLVVRWIHVNGFVTLYSHTVSGIRKLDHASWLS